MLYYTTLYYTYILFCTVNVLYMYYTIYTILYILYYTVLSILY